MGNGRGTAREEMEQLSPTTGAAEVGSPVDDNH